MMPSHWLGMIAAASVGGAFFEGLHVPLPWILGAIFGASFYVNIAGQSPRTRNMRRLGQLFIGTAAASMLTPQGVSVLFALLPFMIGAAIIANVASLMMVRSFCAIANVDRTTGTLSVLPAGLAEMANLAQMHGGSVGVVTASHLLRVLLIVTVVPLVLAVTTGATDPLAAVRLSDAASQVTLTLCLVISAALAFVASRFGMLNPWIVAPMFVGLGFVTLGWEFAPVPQPAVIVAQIAIGGSLGAQLMLRDFIVFPRVLLASLVNTIALCLVMVLVGIALTALGINSSPVSFALALSPGGLGEMIASAQEFGADIALVVGFQFVRSLFTNLVAPFYVGRT